MSQPTVLELCAGYNGLGMAVEEVFGARTVAFSEYDAAPSKILAHHYPDVPNYGDMTRIDWAAIEQADIISGGTPCQDLSAAGRRAGMTEGTRSNLWVQMREAIAIQRPRYVVWENVRGAYSAAAASDLEQCPGCMGDTTDGGVVLRALGRVLGDLSDLGFNAEWRGLRAADVGSCHGRFRVFVLAANRDRIGHKRSRKAWERGSGFADLNCTSTDTASVGWGEGWPEPARLKRGSDAPLGGGKDFPNSVSGRCPGWARKTWGEARWGVAPERSSEGIAWDEYEQGVRSWERINGPAPRPTEPTGRNGNHRLSPYFTEWMMGLPPGWVTDPAIGLTRNEQIKACGNGVVPQQAIAALRDMLAAFQTALVAA